jgi:modulator of FtsH protease HflK
LRLGKDEHITGLSWETKKSRRPTLTRRKCEGFWFTDMPWNNQSSGGNGQGSGGPWGGGSSSGGGSSGGPPDLEELLKRSQDRLKRILPGSGFTAGGIAIVAILLVLGWLASGVYFVSAQEEGVVLLFGRYVSRTAPGMHYRLPWPIETVYTPVVTVPTFTTVGYRANNEPPDESEDDNTQEESLILTGDENIVDINFVVGWKIKDAADYLFNVKDPQATVKAVAESAMREVVGESQIEPILTQNRAEVESQVHELMQQTLDVYRAGIVITQLQMQKADVPPEVADAYRDVQAARSDQETARNKAEAYANNVIPTARGKASKIVQDAEAYRQQVIAEAEGEAKRFLSVYEEYKKAPEVTRRRMYLETMSQVLGDTNKVIIDDSVGKGVVPYLPLPGLERRRTPSVTVTEPGTSSVPSMSASPNSTASEGQQ